MKRGRNTNVFSRWLAKLEDDTVPLGLYLASLLFITLLRSFLEIYGDHTEILFVRFTHYSLFYIVLMAWLSVPLYYLSRRPMKIVIRVLCLGFSIILLAPLLDLLLSGGAGFDTAYLFPEHYPNLWEAFISFFGPTPEKGATIGMRIEIALASLGALLYVFYATRRVLRSLLGGLLTYAIIFLFGIIPYILIQVSPVMGSEFHYSDPVMVRILLFMAIPSVLFIVNTLRGTMVREMIRDLRPLRVLYYVFLIIIGIASGMNRFGASFVPLVSDVFFILISLIFAIIFSIITNNIADKRIDAVSNPNRPTISERIDEGQYRRLAYVSLFLSALFVLPLGFEFLFMMVLFIGSYFLYSMPPFRLKRVFIFSKLPIGFNSLIAILIGFSLVQKMSQGEVNPEALPVYVHAITLIGVTFGAHMIDLKDVRGDGKDGIRTLPVVLGMRTAQWLVALFLFGMYLAISVFLSGGVLDPLLVFAVLAVFFITRNEYKERPVFIVLLLSMVYIIIRLCVGV